MADEAFIPDWTATPPTPGSYRSIAKMGRPDQIELPSPQYTAQLRHELGLTEDFFENKREGNTPVAEPVECELDAGFMTRLRQIAGPENVQTDGYSRVKYSYGKLTEEMVGLKRGVLHEVTGAAVHPRNKDEVAEIVRLCDAARVPLYVYGGGSSVNKGFLPERPGVTLVMSTPHEQGARSQRTEPHLPGPGGVHGAGARGRAQQRARAVRDQTSLHAGPFPAVVRDLHRRRAGC